MAGKGKNTQLEVIHRRDELLKRKIAGQTTAQIRWWFEQNYPNLSEHTMEKDITFAYERLKEYVDRNPDRVIDQHLLLYDDIISKHNAIGLGDTAIRAMIAKEKLLKLHQPENQVNIQQNTIQLPDLSHLSVDELKELLKGEKG